MTRLTAAPSPTYRTAMRTLPLLAALALVLTLAACSSNDPEDVVLPGRDVLVERYGTLAPGTFRVWHPSARLEYRGTEIKLFDPSLYLIGRAPTVQVVLISDATKPDNVAGDFTWSGSYNGSEGPHGCSGRFYVMESTASLLRGVFAGACGIVGPLSGPSNFELIEGGFAYRR